LAKIKGFPGDIKMARLKGLRFLTLAQAEAAEFAAEGLLLPSRKNL